MSIARAIVGLSLVSVGVGCGSTVTLSATGEGGGGAGGDAATTTSAGAGAGDVTPEPVCGECGCSVPAPAPSPDDVSAQAIVADPEATGENLSNGASNVTDEYAMVGAYKSNQNYFERVFKISFDLGTLPEGAEVTSAILAVRVANIMGDVFQNPMTTLVAFPPEKDAYEVGAAVVPPVESGAWSEVDVTAAVRHSLAQCRTWSHLILSFAPENAPGDGSNAFVLMNSASLVAPFANPDYFPRLVVSYAAP